LYTRFKNVPRYTFIKKKISLAKHFFVKSNNPENPNKKNPDKKINIWIPQMSQNLSLNGKKILKEYMELTKRSLTSYLGSSFQK
jgi:hypothetical protein